MSSPARPFEAVRGQFPVTQDLVFFNHASTGPVPLVVCEAVSGLMHEHARLGVTNHAEWSHRYKILRSQIAALVNGREDGVAFVQNTSSGLSIAATGLDWSAGDNVVIPACEFPTNRYPWLNLERFGVEVRQVEAKDGYAHADDVAAAMDSRTRVLSVSFVQYSNGHRYDLASLAEICRTHDSLFVVDGTQGVGALRCDVSALGIDVLAVSAHKWMLGPLGIGFVHCSSSALSRLHPSIVGWLSVDDPFSFNPVMKLPQNAARFEAGTENANGQVGLSATLGLLESLGVDAVEQRVLALTDKLCEDLRHAGCVLKTHRREHNRSGIVVFEHPTLPTETLFARLNDHKVVSAMRNGGIRLSPHYYNSDSEIEQIVELLG